MYLIIQLEVENPWIRTSPLNIVKPCYPIFRSIAPQGPSTFQVPRHLHQAVLLEWQMVWEVGQTVARETQSTVKDSTLKHWCWLRSKKRLLNPSKVAWVIVTELVTTVADTVAAILLQFLNASPLGSDRPVLFDLDVKSIGFNSQVMTCHLSHLRFPCTSWTSGSPKRCRPWAICSAALRFMPRGHRFLWWNSKNKKPNLLKNHKKMTFAVFFPGKNDYKETVWKMICFFLRHWMIGHHTWPSWKTRFFSIRALVRKKATSKRCRFFHQNWCLAWGSFVSLIDGYWF